MADTTTLELSATLELDGKEVPLQSGAIDLSQVTAPSKASIQAVLEKQRISTPPSWSYSWNMTALIAWIVSHLPTGSTALDAIKTFLTSKSANKKLFSEDVTVSHVMASGKGDFSVSFEVKFNDGTGKPASPLVPSGFPLGITDLGFSVVHTKSS